ncbi:MAG: tRNA pseudouridine(38-40) synthase TruA [Myxococcota bacterium]
MREPKSDAAPARAPDAIGRPAYRTLRLVVEYDGSGFEGWQLQAGTRAARTVQGVLAEAFASIGCPARRIQSAGRTDAGVHAEGQVASVDLERSLEPRALVRALNARLPPDVAILRVDAVEPGWLATDAARAKHYRYRIWNGATRSPLRAARFVHVPERLDLDAMRRAAVHLVGTHDFAAFRASGSSARTSVRTIRSIGLEGGAGDEVALDVIGEGFLRHMVRNLAGTLIEIGRGRLPVAAAARILASRDRRQAGPTAPAKGLTLIRVWDGFEPIDGADLPRGQARELEKAGVGADLARPLPARGAPEGD